MYHIKILNPSLTTNFTLTWKFC